MFSEITRRLGANPVLATMAALLSLCIALLGLAPSIYATQVMGPFLTHGRTNTLIAMLIGLMIALLGELLLRVMRFRVLSVIGAEADEDLANALLQRGSEAEHMRAMILLESVSVTYSAGRIATLMDLPTGLLYVAALWWISPDIGFGVCLAVFIVVLFDLAMGRIGGIASASGNVMRGRVMAARSIDSRRVLLADWVDSSVRTGQIGAFREGTVSLSNSLVYCVVLTIGAVLVVNNDVGASVLFGAGMLGSRAAAIFLRSAGLLSELKRGRPAMEAIVKILASPSPATADIGSQFLTARPPQTSSSTH
jgi:ABC-type bacteriocin/lantibiotic exporter with double-glycine peptidase domain